MEYFEEILTLSFKEANLKASNEQIKLIAEDIKISFENYGIDQGYSCIPNFKDEKIKELENLLNNEKNKIICSDCKGKGFKVISGPYHSSEENCFKCKGKGFI